MRSLPCLFCYLHSVIFPFFLSVFCSLLWPLSSHAIAPEPAAPLRPGRVPSPVMHSSTVVEDFLRRGEGEQLRADAGNCKAALRFSCVPFFKCFVCTDYVCIYVSVFVFVLVFYIYYGFQEISVLSILFVCISNEANIFSIGASIRLQKNPVSLHRLQSANLHIDLIFF